MQEELAEKDRAQDFWEGATFKMDINPFLTYRPADRQFGSHSAGFTFLQNSCVKPTVSRMALGGLWGAAEHRGTFHLEPHKKTLSQIKKAGFSKVYPIKMLSSSTVSKK